MLRKTNDFWVMEQRLDDISYSQAKPKKPRITKYADMLLISEAQTSHHVYKAPAQRLITYI